MTTKRPLFVLSLSAFLASLGTLPAAAAISRSVNDRDTVAVGGSVHPAVAAGVDGGPVEKGLLLEKMILVLRLREGATARLERLLTEQQDPSSPNFHRWLTPEEFGNEFGISDEDLAAVVGWLKRNGFGIDEIAKGRGWVNFSGTAAQVEETFQAPLRYLLVDGELHRANVKEVQIPRALTDIVAGVASLHDFFARSPHRPLSKTPVRPGPLLNGPDGTHTLAPADFATIYNTVPLFNSGIDGTGQTIAVVGRTDININDVRNFRSFFGLPTNDPVITHNGPPPGITDADNELEADLDVEWSGAVAPGATINFVVSKGTTTSFGEDLSAQYIVNNNLAPVMTLSFGTCEDQLGPKNLFYSGLFAQASAQGISVFVSSGDSGTAGCDVHTASIGSGQAVNGLCSTPYNVCVGGTQFLDTANPSEFWNATNDPVTRQSVKSHIPEQAWNESGAVQGGSGLWATGGGRSNVYAKPSWQAAPGVPNDGVRDVPDVALAAAAHVGYVICRECDFSTGSGVGVADGTSAAAPSFAGIMALVVQKAGGRLGNPNPGLYALANAQYGGTGGPTPVFHDVTVGNNSVPGVTGFSCGPGYDLATGLGSVDANNLVLNFPSGVSHADFTVSVTPSSLSIQVGESQTVTVTVVALNGFSSTVSLAVSGMPTGMTAGFSPANVAGGSGTSALTITAGGVGAGTYPLSIVATGGGLTLTAALSAVVAVAGGPTFSVSLSPPSVSAVAASILTVTVGCSASGGFNSPVSFSTANLPSGATTSFSPASITCGLFPSSMKISLGTAAPGPYTVTVSGSGGGLTRNAVLGLTVRPVGASTVLFVPVVLKSSGESSSFFTSEMTLTNRGSTNVMMTFRYTASSGGGDGAGLAFLPARRQVIVADAIEYLRSVGVPIPDSGNRFGTLRIQFDGISSAGDVSVVVRTTTPVPPSAPTGVAGLAYPGVPLSKLPSGPVLLCGLRQDSLDRTNIAVQNAGETGQGDISLRITMYSGVPPLGSQVFSQDVSLGPGGFSQVSVPPGSFGYARVEQLSGTAPFYAYAVINDNFNSDGSFVLPLPEASLGGTNGVTLPVVLEVSVYSTEVVVTNLSGQQKRVHLSFYAAALGSQPASIYVDLPPGSQSALTNAIQAMRQAGQNVPSGVVGPMFMTVDGGSTQGLFIGGRTGNPGGGGRYSLFYSGVPFGTASTKPVWINGLQQNSTTRSNLALVNTGEVNGAASSFRIEIFDGDSGTKAGQTTVSVAAFCFLQLDSILATYAPGTKNAYALVTKTGGVNPFIAYGVVNDGANPGDRSGDGAFVLSEEDDSGTWEPRKEPPPSKGTESTHGEHELGTREARPK